jgi:hypothetical protein
MELGICKVLQWNHDSIQYQHTKTKIQLPTNNFDHTYKQAHMYGSNGLVSLYTYQTNEVNHDRLKQT